MIINLSWNYSDTLWTCASLFKVMEKARQRGLRLEGLNDDDELDDLDRIKQIDIIKSLPVNFQIKKMLR